jgi:long-chain fatty acid transport protein
MKPVAISRAALFLSLSFLGGPLPASAGDGYFLIGYGPRQKALGGAGVADQTDAMALSVNPAGIVGLERQFQFGLAALNADRGYDTFGPTRVVAPGHVVSGRPWFPVPNGGYVQPIDADSSWSIVSYANGGVNTSYGWGNYRAPFGGPFGGGFAGTDLQQAFVSVGYAQRVATPIGAVSIGVAPTIAMQMFNLQGAVMFSPYSSNPSRLSGMAYDWSGGGGMRVGVNWAATDRLRFGFAGSTPMWMTPMTKYAGILANHGNFDIPATLQAGLAYDLTPDLTAMLDWRHIFYSAVPTLGNPSNPLFYNSMGGPNAGGFDWTDIDAGSVGVEWRALPALTLRAGYHYTSNPLRWRSVTVNVFSPIVVQNHATLGANYVFTRNSSLDFAFAYGFKNTFTGVEWLPQQPGLPIGSANPRATISLWAQGFELTLGYNYKWDKADASLIPTHF